MRDRSDIPVPLVRVVGGASCHQARRSWRAATSPSNADDAALFLHQQTRNLQECLVPHGAATPAYHKADGQCHLPDRGGAAGDVVEHQVRHLISKLRGWLHDRRQRDTCMSTYVVPTTAHQRHVVGYRQVDLLCFLQYQQGQVVFCGQQCAGPIGAPQVPGQQGADVEPDRRRWEVGRRCGCANLPQWIEHQLFIVIKPVLAQTLPVSSGSRRRCTSPLSTWRLATQ